MYKLMVMSFDGDYKIEPFEFDSVQDAWEYSNDMGSKWFFYPFHFVIKNQTIKDAPDILFDGCINKRIKTISKKFEKTSKILPDNADCIDFALYMARD